MVSVLGSQTRGRGFEPRAISFLKKRMDSVLWCLDERAELDPRGIPFFAISKEINKNEGEFGKIRVGSQTGSDLNLFCHTHEPQGRAQVQIPPVDFQDGKKYRPGKTATGGKCQLGNCRKGNAD